MDYSLTIRKLVTEACPEFFDATGGVKKTCVPAHQAALYRHFPSKTRMYESLIEFVEEERVDRGGRAMATSRELPLGYPQ